MLRPQREIGAEIVAGSGIGENLKKVIPVDTGWQSVSTDLSSAGDGGKEGDHVAIADDRIELLQ